MGLASASVRIVLYGDAPLATKGRISAGTIPREKRNGRPDMSRETEGAVGRLMILFAERYRGRFFRRAVQTNPDLLLDEVKKVIAEARKEMP